MKKKLILTIVLIIIASSLGCVFFSVYFPKLMQKINFENSVLSFSGQNENTVFSIDKITLFSGCDAKNKASSATNFTIENLYTYTDIAIFINQENEEPSLENTLKEVSIENIEINPIPCDGQANIFFKNMMDFAKPYIPETGEIKDNLSFNTTSEEISDFSSPVLYNNCANPITLSYIHQNVKTDYTLLDITNPITYDGSLLKRCGIALSKLATEISFDMYITNYKDEKFKSKIFIPITYQNDTASIYDGTITIKQDVNYVFYRYK